MKRKLLYVCALLFSVLTFFGVGYVFYTNGTASPGYAAVPLLGTIIFLQLSRRG